MSNRQSRLRSIAALSALVVVLSSAAMFGAYAWRRAAALAQLQGHAMVFDRAPHWLPKRLEPYYPEWMRSVYSVKCYDEEPLSAFIALNEVEELDLRETGTRDAQLASLRGCRRLTVLDLSDTPVGDAGLLNLTRAPLQQIRLCRTRVTDSGIIALGAIKTLTDINLEETQVGDAGVQQLAHLPLESLGLHLTLVTDAGLSELRDQTRTLSNVTLTCPSVSRLAAVEFAQSLGLPVELQKYPGFQPGGVSLDCRTPDGLCAQDIANFLPSTGVVANIQSSGPAARRSGLVVHIRNWSILPIEKFGVYLMPHGGPGLTPDELAWQDSKIIADVKSLQDEQVTVFRRLLELGVREVWYEGLTDETLTAFKANSRGIEQLSLIRKIRLGAPGRLASEGWLKVLPLNDAALLLRESTTGTEDTARAEQAIEDAMVKRLLSSPGHTAVALLAGTHDLRDNLDRLGAADWQLVTIDVRMYQRLAGEQ